MESIIYLILDQTTGEELGEAESLAELHAGEVIIIGDGPATYKVTYSNANSGHMIVRPAAPDEVGR